MARPSRIIERTGGRTGHTLTEMLVVLAILGVMAGAVVPVMRNARDEDGVAQTARVLVELMNHSRASAADRGVVITLVVDPATGRAWTSEGDDAALVPDSLTAPLAESLARARHAGAPVTITAAAPRARWTFAPSGLAFGDPILVRDPTHAVLVTVDRWTGEVHAHSR